MDIRTLKRKIKEIIQQSGQKNPLVIVEDNEGKEYCGAYFETDEVNHILVMRKSECQENPKVLKIIEIPFVFIKSVRYVPNEEAAMLISRIDDLMQSY